jgi:hypothetical protein
MTTFNFVAIVNLILCAAGIWMCVCRARHMSLNTTRRSVRLWYGFLFTALASALVVPQTASIVFVSAAIVVYLISGIKDWWNGQPDHARHDGTAT